MNSEGEQPLPWAPNFGPKVKQNNALTEVNFRSWLVQTLQSKGEPIKIQYKSAKLPQYLKKRRGCRNQNFYFSSSGPLLLDVKRKLPYINKKCIITQYMILDVSNIPGGALSEPIHCKSALTFRVLLNMCNEIEPSPQIKNTSLNFVLKN